VTEYGNDLRIVARAGIIGGVLGLALVGAGIVAIVARGRWNEASSLVLLLMFLLPPGALVLVVGITACFSIRVRDERVQHVFLRRLVLQDRPLVDFRGVRLTQIGPVLDFRGHQRIWFIGAHMSVIARMDQDLKELAKLARNMQRTSGRQ